MSLYFLIVSVLVFIPVCFTFIHALLLIPKGGDVEPIKLFALYIVLVVSGAYPVVCIIDALTGG